MGGSAVVVCWDNGSSLELNGHYIVWTSGEDGFRQMNLVDNSHMDFDSHGEVAKQAHARCPEDLPRALSAALGMEHKFSSLAAAISASVDTNMRKHVSRSV